MSQNAGASKPTKRKSSSGPDYPDGDIIIIRKQSKKKS